MRIKERAKQMYEFRTKHGIPGDDKGDYFTAQHFENDTYWQEQIILRRAWEKKKRKLIKPKMTVKELFYCWLRVVIYGWIDEPKKENLWKKSWIISKRIWTSLRSGFLRWRAVNK